MDAIETNTATGVKIVTVDDGLKVEQTVALPELMETMESRLQDLVADHEDSANEPVRLDPGPPPVWATLGDLEQTAAAQSAALDRITTIVEETEGDVRSVDLNLRADVIATKRLEIRQAALAKASEFYAPMAARSRKARSTEEFYQRRSVLIRARFPGSNSENHMAVCAWVQRLASCPAFLLVEFARQAAGSANAALGSLVFEATLARKDADGYRPAVESALASIRLSESDEALSLISAIVMDEKKAGIQLLRLHPTRLDSQSKSGMGKISAGLDQRGRPGAGALVR